MNAVLVFDGWRERTAGIATIVAAGAAVALVVAGAVAVRSPAAAIPAASVRDARPVAGSPAPEITHAAAASSARPAAPQADIAAALQLTTAGAEEIFNGPVARGHRRAR